MTHLRDLNRARSYQQGVEDERKRCLEICREHESHDRAMARGMNDMNSVGWGMATGAADAAHEIANEILGADE